ncbi:MAG: enoyl-CoA hydratase-related protein, partial [bacterium]|nr:enoyl-CoA hydratase-related protein [bacterium]
MAYENLILTNTGNVKIITINRPGVLNALNKKTLLELEQVLQDVENKETVQAVIITGSGEKSFVAGADINEMKNLSPIEAEMFSGIGHRVFDFIGQMSIPVIAAVNGFALGGGLELALACDFIYASENSFFGLVETKLGLIPGFGGVARLSRRVGVAYAREMIFSATQIDANEALRVALINRITTLENLIPSVLEVTKKISNRGPYAIAIVKKLISAGQDTNLHSANVMEKHAFGLVFSSKDRSEGIKAFMEKRTPSFEG